jgi:hypothetical protein
VANVYRKGAKSVHIGTRRRPGMGVETIPGCNLDPGGEWRSDLPAGTVCVDCFGASAASKGRGTRAVRGGAKAATLGTAAALALAAAVVGSSLGEPVNILVLPTNSVGPAFSALPSVTPGPLVPSTGAPALTFPPFPSYPPVPTVSVPTYPPTPTFAPLPTFPPFPTFGPLPTLDPPPLPTLAPKVCVHPGIHVGVTDLCKWPHN